MERVYPPVTEEHLFGLIKREKPDPRLAERQQQLKLTIWSAGIGIVLLLFWLNIPKALKRAEQRARAYESQADNLLATQPSQSIILYRTAISMASDPNYEEQLVSKLDKLDKQLSQVAGLNDTNADVEHTYILSNSEIKETGKLKDIAKDRYRLEKELGKGAMGIVYYAHDVILERYVAIKELPIYLSNKEYVQERFQQEAKALARLAHPNIVQVYDFLVEDNRTCIVMEFVDGLSLDEYLKEDINLSLQQSIMIGKQLAQAMMYAHERGVIHRDFKTANVLLTKDLTPKVTDFGLAKITESSVETLSGTVMGSPAFMSPEQALGNLVDERTDIYSLGITLYKMFTGAFPFTGDSISVMSKQVNCAPIPPHKINKNVPKYISELIIRMMAKNPDDRIQTMAVVTDQLEEKSEAERT